MGDTTEKLFSEFKPITTQEWEEVINRDLKGADYDKKLLWKTIEGFTVKPYYRAEDIEQLAYLTKSVPAAQPFVRGSKTTCNRWNIVQEIPETDPVKANAIAIDALAKGANEIVFRAETITELSDLSSLLKGIDLTQTGVRFEGAKCYISLAKLLVAFVEQNKIDKTQVKGAFHFDPICYLLAKGSFWHSQKDDMEELITLCQLMKDFAKFQLLTVNGAFLHNCGATIVQELGYVLAMANEYVAFATQHNIAADVLLSKIGFTMAISSNYFMEIAKLRAARLLWSTIAQQYKPTNVSATKMNVFSQSSMWNKTIYDPYVNMLRITTEGMSAAIGGADSIALAAFDAAYKTSDDFSARIARNTQILLKEESYFDKIVDPSAGSYYIENLTDNIARIAWDLFVSVEKEGGMIAVSKTGLVKQNIEASCKKRDADISTRKSVILGTNQYPNITETMGDKVQEIKKSHNAGLNPYRAAMPFEDLRLATEQYAKTHGTPKVFLLKIGNISMRQARAGFITNFFGCAGYQIIETGGYKTAVDGVKDALASKANIVAICSSDEEYADFSPAIAKELKAASPKTKCVVAGNPVELIESLKNAGVDDFIHVKVNLLETLKAYNNYFGI